MSKMKKVFELFPDDADYEVKERMAILEIDNDVEYHPAHLKNKAAKEVRLRQAEGTKAEGIRQKA